MSPSLAGKSDLMYTFARNRILNFLFEYKTAKVVKVHSTRLGIINRTVQFLLVGYIIGYIFVYAKGYQSFEKAESNTVAKVKGMVKKNYTSLGADSIWDSTDIVIPSVENDAVFITTNFIATPGQQSGRCPEVGDQDITIKSAKCRNDSDCENGQAVLLGNGFQTGVCVPAFRTCEIRGWCPTEYDVRPEPPLFMEAANFTMLVKNYIFFPGFNVKRRNIPHTMTRQYMATCRYHPASDPFCPIFVVNDLVEMAGEKFSEVARSGAIFSFIIEWDCNLDFSEEYCVPKYRIRRLDSLREKLAKGWNFRHAEYSSGLDGRRRRTLFKFYGIRFVFTVYGKAGRFNAEQFAMNLGSGVGLLGIATVLCNFLTDFLLKTSYLRTDHDGMERICSGKKDRSDVPSQRQHFTPTTDSGGENILLSTISDEQNVTTTADHDSPVRKPAIECIGSCTRERSDPVRTPLLLHELFPVIRAREFQKTEEIAVCHN